MAYHYKGLKGKIAGYFLDYEGEHLPGTIAKILKQNHDEVRKSIVEMVVDGFLAKGHGKGNYRLSPVLDFGYNPSLEFGR